MGSDADDLSRARADGSGGERRDPGAVAVLVLRRAVVARAGIVGLINLAQIQREVRRDVGVRLVDAAIENGDANTVSHGSVPRAVRRSSGDVASVASHLADGPSLRRRRIEAVVGLQMSG